MRQWRYGKVRPWLDGSCPGAIIRVCPLSYVTKWRRPSALARGAIHLSHMIMWLWGRKIVLNLEMHKRCGIDFWLYSFEAWSTLLFNFWPITQKIAIIDATYQYRSSSRKNSICEFKVRLSGAFKGIKSASPCPLQKYSEIFPPWRCTVLPPPTKMHHITIICILASYTLHHIYILLCIICN